MVMTRKWGIVFILIGIFLIFAQWLVPLLKTLPDYLRLLFAFIFQYKPFLERIFPASLILLGFAILVRGFLRRICLFLAFVVAFISIIAMVLPGHGVIADKKIEFFVGDVVVEWGGGEGWDGWDGWDGWSVWKSWRDNGLKVVKVEGESLDIEFFAGSVKVLLPSDKDVSVNIDGGVGEIKVFAPKNVEIEVEGDLGIGNFENNHVVKNPEHTAKISYDLGIGKVEIE